MTASWSRHSPVDERAKFRHRVGGGQQLCCSPIRDTDGDVAQGEFNCDADVIAEHGHVDGLAGQAHCDEADHVGWCSDALASDRDDLVALLQSCVIGWTAYRFLENERPAQARFG